MAVDPKSKETRKRLEKCWAMELNWDLFPDDLKKVTKLCSDYSHMVMIKLLMYSHTCLSNSIMF